MVSNLTIAQFISIGLSDNLSQGLRFGSQGPGVSNSNATAPDSTNGNFNSTLQSGFWVNVTDSTGAGADVCLGSNRSLRDDSSAVEINNSGNYTLSVNNTTNSLLFPGPVDSYSMPLGLVNFSETRNIANGSLVYFRFHLDVPDNQPPGSYTSGVTFRAVKGGNPCGSL